ncbi:MAG: cell surface protein SprA [Flavobacteriales bacterium]|nr:cell surface protein SprA [Flavobacteriales bacterium]
MVFQNKAIHKQALWCFFLFLVLSKFSFSQSTNDSLIFQLPESQSWDNPLDEPSSGFYLSTPSNLQPQLEYDPETKLYSVEQNINGFRLSNPTFLSSEEYDNYNSKQSIVDYWKEKTSNPSLSGDNVNKGPLSIDIGGEIFDKIFGNSTVDIRPQGSAELIFSIKHNKTENNALPIDKQSNTSFDFKQKIQMNVIGKIGDKLQLNTNYNTEAIFDFDNKIKLEYEGEEDEIIKKIEIGNVGLPLNGTLISGSQSLLGLKTQLQFGRATVTTIFSQQKSNSKVIDVSGGAQTTDFDIYADQYETNKHFFLSHYFKSRYNEAMSQLPFINSPVNITKIEVWVTNKTGTIEDTRNILAFLDLGESQADMYNTNLFSDNADFSYPDNDNNTLYQQMLAEGTDLRNINQVNSIFNATSYPDFLGSQDYEKLERARLLSPTEYTFHPQLGFISLNSVIGPDEVLAVAFQYTIGNELYQVGEFSSNGPSAPSSLYVKLLKNLSFSPLLPNWDLMMKNIYSLGAYNVSSTEFYLDVVFENTRDNGTITNYIPEDGLTNKPIINLLSLDQLNAQQERRSDGIFDFLPDITIITSNGKIIFPVREPFGEDLRSKFSNNDIADNYVYDVLYDSTLTIAQQFPEYNKFRIKGSYQSESGAEIYLGVFSIEQGSVVVTAGGLRLEEGKDFTVNYSMGKVNIINDGILLSGTPIRISVESNSFGLQQKTLVGTHVDYRISDDFMLGGTILNLTEKPYSKKVNSGDEPISNTIWGLDGTYRTESNLLTKIVDFLPLLETKEKSMLTAQGEFAHLIPGHQRAIGESGTAYIDDFEASSTGIDIKNPGAWFLASLPNDPDLFPESALGNQSPRLGNLNSGANRALMSWYNIDPAFYRNSTNTPSHIANDDTQLSNHSVREVLEKEVFPNRDPQYATQVSNLPIFNLSYNPSKRGPYNFDTDNITTTGLLLNPENRWAGIMRKLETTDFELQNIEFVEFWIMDPFNEDSENQNGGNLIMNLGNVSEDVLKDGFKSFENGLPSSEILENIDDESSVWGRMPTTFALTNSFDVDAESRQYQDVGLDGLRDVDERAFFDTAYIQKIETIYGVNSEAYTLANTDPSSDNYTYFLGDALDGQSASILKRYEYFSGIDGNSAIPNPTPTMSTTIPNTEDINFDNTLNESESYYHYNIPLFPNMQIGDSYITDIQETTAKTPTGDRSIKWYQFKIPVQQPDKTVGSIRDFKSIRFIRMLLKDFDQPIVMRFATLELVRGEWRRYNFSLKTEGEYVPNDNSSTTSFDVSVVNIEENAEKIPVPYVLPPGIEQEVDNTTTYVRRQNEQSLVLKVCDLEDGDSRAAYKTFNNDFRTYKRLKMYVHAEASGEVESALQDGELSLFVRLGTDFNDNYYEYEIPLKVTPWGVSRLDDQLIWPIENELNITFEQLLDAKQERNKAVRDGIHSSTTDPFSGTDKQVTVVGNPNISMVKTIMLGVRNPRKGSPNTTSNDDGSSKCGEIWLNELRLTDFDERGGYAANGRINARLADFANVNLTGSMSTIGFGSIDQSLTARQKYDAYQYDFSSTFALGNFFGEKAAIKIPMYVGISEAIQNPQYNPLDPDITLKASLDELQSNEEKEELKEIAQDLTKRKSINFTNVRKNKSSSAGNKTKIYDIENLSATYSRNETFSRNVSLKERTTVSTKASLNYTYSSKPKNIKPFQKVKLFKNKYFALLKDFNFYTLPKSISFQTDLDRYYNKTQFRNINNPDFTLPPYYNKAFVWNRNYSIKYDLTRTLKTEFKVNNSASIDEPQGELVRSDPYYQEKKDSVWNNILNFGRPTLYHHSLNASYNVPLNKFPLTSWINLNTKYVANYDWLAAPLSLQSLGNTIQNSNNKQINSTFNFGQLYNKVPFLKKLNRTSSRNVTRGRGSTRESIRLPNEAQDTVRVSMKDIVNGVLKTALLVKNISISYRQNQGVVLPGFNKKPHFFGQDWDAMAPGIPFALGSQNIDIRELSSQGGWLTSNTDLNQFFKLTNSETLNLRGTLEPIKGFRIELTANRTKTNNSQEIYKYDPNLGDYESFNTIENGSHSISFISWNTSFIKDDDNYSNATFQQFRDNREVIANRLAGSNPYDNSIVDSTGYPLGYQSNSQDVLIPAFLAAYSGKNASSVGLNNFPNIPLPNWRINFDGLRNLKWIKKRMNNIVLSHSYQSTYSVGNYVTSLDYEEGFDQWPNAINEATLNYYDKYEINQVTLRESLNPLFKIDMTFKNSMTARLEIKKERTLSLGLSNNQLTDRSSDEWIVGTGYRIKELSFNVRAAGKQRKISSDLDLKLDFSLRSNKVIIRKIEENQEEITGGNSVITLKFTADYVVSSRFNLRLFFDKVMTNPYVSNTFPSAITNGGFSVRFTLAQ